MAGLDAERIRKDFPILAREMNGKRLVYLDNAATSQKPVQVLKAMDDFYAEANANIHRGVYQLSEDATEAYEASKEKVAGFINARGKEEIVYVRNATEAINLVAMSWGGSNVVKGDRILISEMEHHSNIVPWQQLARRTGAVLDYVKIDPSAGTIDERSLAEGLGRRPKLVAITHVSNVLGTVNDINGIVKASHDAGAVVLVDGAQSAPHMRVNVREMGCDFFAVSAHKMLGPTGIGALYGSSGMLEAMEPFLTGGDMIREVGLQDSTWNGLPWKFEAGTPNIAGAVGFGAAVDYLVGIGMDRVEAHEKALTRLALEGLAAIDGVKVYGPDMGHIGMRGGIVSFSVEGVHPHDVAEIFNRNGIAIRAGHHCAMPLVKGVLHEPALSRMSFYVYNDGQEVDKAMHAMSEVDRIFRSG